MSLEYKAAHRVLGGSDRIDRESILLIIYACRCRHKTQREDILWMGQYAEVGKSLSEVQQCRIKAFLLGGYVSEVVVPTCIGEGAEKGWVGAGPACVPSCGVDHLLEYNGDGNSMIIGSLAVYRTKFNVFFFFLMKIDVHFYSSVPSKKCICAQRPFNMHIVWISGCNHIK